MSKRQSRFRNRRFTDAKILSLEANVIANHGTAHELAASFDIIDDVREELEREMEDEEVAYGNSDDRPVDEVMIVAPKLGARFEASLKTFVMAVARWYNLSGRVRTRRTMDGKTHENFEGEYAHWKKLSFDNHPNRRTLFFENPSRNNMYYSATLYGDSPYRVVVSPTPKPALHDLHFFNDNTNIVAKESRKIADFGKWMFNNNKRAIISNFTIKDPRRPNADEATQVAYRKWLASETVTFPRDEDVYIALQKESKKLHLEANRKKKAINSLFK